MSSIRSEGHASKHLAGGFEDDEDHAISKMNEHADRLREQHPTDLVAAVMDTSKPVVSYDPPMLGWQYVAFVDEHGERLV